MKASSLPTALRLLPVLAAALLTTSPHTATAATVVSNLGNASDGSLPVQFQNLFGGIGDIRANSFTTGASAATLNSVTLGMNAAFVSVGGFSLSLYTDGGVAGPGTLISTLTGAADPATAGDYTYTAGGPLALTANTTYFVVAAVPQTGADNQYQWSFTGTNSVTTSEGWTIANGSWGSQDGGTSWVQFGFTSAGRFSVDATVVPEPSSALLLGGLSTVFLRRRRKQA